MLKNKLRKAYISIEVVILASIVIIGGLCGLSAFLKNGQGAQSQAAEAMNNTIDMIGEEFDFTIGGGEFPGGGGGIGGGADEAEWYIEGTTPWVAIPGMELEDGSPIKEALEEDLTLLADNMAYPDESNTGHVLGAGAITSWLITDDAGVSLNDVPPSPGCTGPYKYVYYGDLMVGYYSNNCKNASEAMVYFDKENDYGVIAVYDEHFEIRDAIVENTNQIHYNQKYSGYNANEPNGSGAGEHSVVFYEDGTVKYFLNNTLQQTLSYTLEGSLLNVVGFGAAVIQNNGTEIYLANLNNTFILSDAVHEDNGVEYVYLPDRKQWYVSGITNTATNKLYIATEIRGYVVANLLNTERVNEDMIAWMNGNAEAIVYNGVEYTDLEVFFDALQDYVANY